MTDPMETRMTSENTATAPGLSTLVENGQLRSDLWLDQPDAHDRIDARLAAGAISAADAESLHLFVDKGYMTTHIDLDRAAAEAFDAQVARLWDERPADLAISPPGPGGPRSFAAYEGSDREVGYRIPDLHGYSDHAMDLYLHSEIFRCVELIFDQPAIAFQSLYFEFGSAQALHRDPMFVVTRPASHMAAAWIALEDITPDSGPLAYVPGSHRLPWFAFEEDSIVLVPRVPQEKRMEYAEFTRRNMTAAGFEPVPFTCKRGDVFIWHAGLVHGGSEIENPERTRKSFVIHYSTAANYTERTAGMQVREGGEMRGVRRRTDTIVTSAGGRGLDSPMKLRD
jgi:phytanoyl-CoA hydroxylase